MAVDKVIDSAELDANLTAVADAIRTKGGTSEALSFPDGFVSAVEGIQAGGGGDDALLSFINRSVTSFTSNDLTAISYENACFKSWSSLTSVRLPNVTTLCEGAFRYCTNLTEVYLPKVTSIPKYCYTSCGFITYDFSKITYINNDAFNSCINLRSDNLDFGSLNSIGSGLFSGCTSLEELNFPVLSGTFYANTLTGCTGLKKVIIGKAETPTTFGIERAGCFNGCTQLATLILHVTKVPTFTSTNAFTNTPIANGTGYIYVPSALVDSFKSATNWSTYADQIRAIEDYPEICGEVSA